MRTCVTAKLKENQEGKNSPVVTDPTGAESFNCTIIHPVSSLSSRLRLYRKSVDDKLPKDVELLKLDDMPYNYNSSTSGPQVYLKPELVVPNCSAVKLSNADYEDVSMYSFTD